MNGETENRVKELLAEGLSNKEIADRVHLSVRAVKWHTGNLYVKYGLRGTADQRRLIVVLVREMFALTDRAAAPNLPASALEKKHDAHTALQL